MKRLVTVVVLISLLVSSTVVFLSDHDNRVRPIFEERGSYGDSNDLEIVTTEDHRESNDNISRYEQDRYGESWFDSFQDMEGIENAINLNVDNNNGSIVLNRTGPEPHKSTDNTMGLWHFDNNSGSVAFDAGSHNNDGEIHIYDDDFDDDDPNGWSANSGTWNFKSGGINQSDSGGNYYLYADSLNLSTNFTYTATVFIVRGSIGAGIMFNFKDAVGGYQLYLNMDSKEIVLDKGGPSTVHRVPTIDYKTTYWLRVVKTGAAINGYLSTDGINYGSPIIKDSDADSDFIGGTIGLVTLCSSAIFDDVEVLGEGWCAGKFGSAIELDGKDDHIDCGDKSVFNVTKEITIEAWINLNSTSGTNWILSKKEDSGSGYGFGISDGELSFVTGSWSEKSKTAMLSTHEWYHVAVRARHETTCAFPTDGSIV